jgi:hypothetical protein
VAGPHHFPDHAFFATKKAIKGQKEAGGENFAVL